MIYTDELKAILDYLRVGNGHLLIDALAGTGKTTALLEALAVIPQKSVLLCAFNKRTADELATKILLKKRKGSVFAAATFHSAGLRILNRHKRLQIDNRATEGLVNDACMMADGKMSISFKGRRAATQLLRMTKETFSGPEATYEGTMELGIAYDLFASIASPDEISNIVYVVQRAYDLGLNLDKRDSIDYCDMTWLPVVLELKPPSRYQAVFVDELQDLSLLQWELVKSLVAPGGRIVGVGDTHQQIYAWRGSIGPKIWTDLVETCGAKHLPLTTTFRCSTVVVQQAQQLVPALQAIPYNPGDPTAPKAPDGSVTTVEYNELRGRLARAWEEDTFVLSRTNADLLQVALDLFSADVPFRLAAGKEIISPLIEILDKLDKTTAPRFRASLITWFNAETMKAEKLGSSAAADRIEQQFSMFAVLLDFAEPSDMKVMLDELAGETIAITAITLSTVHKAKGLEADRVYLLRQSFHRHQTWRAEKKLTIEPEELNIEYVAITRAKHHLIWVNMPDGLSASARALASSLMDEATRRRVIAETPREQTSLAIADYTPLPQQDPYDPGYEPDED